ncbi:MAG TPA: ATP-dependent Clp protease proteolytic subunit [Nocardioides sp.]|nr:ATP-dependent Clp protease proteolytic subunit [Nocardioides sp.]
MTEHAPSAEEREKFAAEAAKLRYEATTARCAAETAELALATARHDAALRRSADSWHKVFHFEARVQSTLAFREELAKEDRIDPDADWTVVINSPGGSVIDGMALFDDLVAYSRRGGGRHRLTIKARGYAASMAGILLQAADHRVCGPESYILVHEVASMTAGKIGDIEDEVKLLKMMSDRVVDIFVERSGGKISRRTFISKWRRTDWWLDSKAALRFGLVDAVA